MEKTILEIERLSHRYSSQWAVKNVSFDVKEHEICGLLGSNGAGKSTVMNIVCGILKQTYGNVFINGVDTKNALLAKSFIGFLPQVPPIYNEFTVEEYLRHAAELRRVANRDIKKAVDRVLEKCAISHFRKRLLSNLSGGYKQRVGIAQAIIHSPKLVIFDEPTNGLDPTQILYVRETIRNIAEESTVLLSTHLLQEVQAVCSKIIMMEGGKLIFKGSVDDFDNYIMPDTIYVKINSDVSVSDIGAIDGVLGVEPLGDCDYRIKFNDPEEVLENIVIKAAENSWHLAEMKLEKSSLDLIFAELKNKKK